MTKAEEAKLAAMEQAKLDAEAALAALEKDAEKKDAERAELENTVRVLNGRVDELATEVSAERAKYEALHAAAGETASKNARLVADLDELTTELGQVKRQRDEAAERSASLAAQLGTATGRALASKDTATREMFSPSEVIANAIGVVLDAPATVGDLVQAVTAGVMASTGLDFASADARLGAAFLNLRAEAAAIDRAARESKGSTS